MGWSGGSEMMEQIIAVLRPELGDKARERIYPKLIRIFEDQDCDTLCECDSDPVFVKCLKKLGYMADD